MDHPSVKPENPKEIGAMPTQPPAWQPVSSPFDETASMASLHSDTVTAATAAGENAVAVSTLQAAAAAGKPVGTVGKQAAPFHMKPSKVIYACLYYVPPPAHAQYLTVTVTLKEPKRLDLGEAYLMAQTAKGAALAVQLAAKTKGDMIVALASAGKSPDEIKALLLLLL